MKSGKTARPTAPGMPGMPGTPGSAVTARVAAIVAALIAVTGLCVTGPARAQPQRNESAGSVLYRVKKGDTVALIAAEHYGDRNYAILIMAENSMQHNTDLKPGRRLRIPINVTITTDAGDTLQSLAKRYLDDERRAGFLANFNDLPPDASLPAGQTVKIPLRVRHTAAGQERLSDIASSYFGSRRKRKKTDFIKEYNFLTADVLEAGQTIVIPIDNVQVRESKVAQPDKESTARRARRKAMQTLATKRLPEARLALGQGRYEEVKELLTEIETEYLDVDMAVEIGVLLGSAYVAFDDETTARVHFEKVLERAPAHVLDPYAHSPRIRKVWRNAGGKVRGRE